MLFATLDSTVSAHSTAVCSQTCGQKPLSEHPRDRGQKAVFIVYRSAADGCFVAPVCRIVPLLERLSKSFMQGQAAQNLHRYRQRIHSRICPLKIKLTLQKYYFGLNLVSPQKLLHSRNSCSILRERLPFLLRTYVSRRSSIVQPRTFARLRTVSALALLMSLLRCSYI